MSGLIREFLSKRKKLDEEMRHETTRMADFFICYLSTAREIMKGSEQLMFHNPNNSTKRDYKTTFTKDNIILYGTYYTPYTYLMRAWSEGFHMNGFEKTLEDLEKSPLNKRVTPEMVMRKYNHYKELLEGCSFEKLARKKFLSQLGMN